MDSTRPASQMEAVGPIRSRDLERSATPRAARSRAVTMREPLCGLDERLSSTQPGFRAGSLTLSGPVKSAMQRVKAAALTEIAARGWVIVNRREWRQQPQPIRPKPSVPD
jgi:hypothetical protein